MTTRNQDGGPKKPNSHEQLNSRPIGTKHLRTREPITDEDQLTHYPARQKFQLTNNSHRGKEELSNRYTLGQDIREERPRTTL